MGNTFTDGVDASGSIVPLVSLAYVKRRLGITGTDNDTRLQNCIDAATLYIEGLTGRKLAARDIRDWHSLTSQKIVVLPNYPVNDIYQVAWGQQNAISVSYGGSDIQASARVNEDGVDLRSIAADGSVTSNALTFASNPTLSTMATAMNAVTDWTCSKLIGGDGESYKLQRITISDAKTNTRNLTYADRNEDSYHLRQSTGELVFEDFFSTTWPDERINFVRGFETLFVHYNAGYATVPADLTEVAAEMASEVYQMAGKDSNVTSESLGDYSYTLADQAARTTRAADRLTNYMDLVIGQSK